MKIKFMCQAGLWGKYELTNQNAFTYTSTVYNRVFIIQQTYKAYGLFASPSLIQRR